MTTSAQTCPICSRPVPPTPRYPRCVCAGCARKVTSPGGRPLRFFNEDLSGGYAAEYADTGEKYPSHECIIEGVKCLADEAHFGGIVIQVAPD